MPEHTHDDLFLPTLFILFQMHRKVERVLNKRPHTHPSLWLTVNIVQLVFSPTHTCFFLDHLQGGCPHNDTPKYLNTVITLNSLSVSTFLANLQPNCQLPNCFPIALYSCSFFSVQDLIKAHSLLSVVVSP